MDAKRLIFLFYMLYTFYSILMCGTTDLTIFYLIPALILIWFCYATLSYSIGKKEIKICNNESNNQLLKCFGLSISQLKTIPLLLIGFISLISSFICAKYYTGLSPLQVINNILSNQSNYISYQIYFQKSNIGVFSIIKIPYILLMGLNNILYVYSLIILSMQKNKIRFDQFIYLILVSCAHLYFGVARGTNYEAYQLFLIVCFCYTIRLNVKNQKFKIGVPLFLGLILVFVFFSVLDSRGIEANYTIAEHIHYDETEFFSSLFPNLSKYYVSLYSYLGFGIYYIATMINNVWFNTFSDSLRGIIPFINFGYNESSVEITNRLVVIGVKWVPDAASILNAVGLFGLICMYYCVGKIYKKIDDNNTIGNELTAISSYLVFVFCVTIPSGHFITFSSEQILIAYTVYKVFIVQIKDRRKV